MAIVSTALLLLAALASAPVIANGEAEIYTASTRGQLTIDAEGRVVDVKLDRKQLGDDVMQGFERQIREWRFEPILHDGRPVRAEAHMGLSLAVVRQPGVDGLRLAFEQVYFTEPSGNTVVDGEKRRMGPPRYPVEAMKQGVGARVMLMLRLDEEGRVVQAATDDVRLLGEEVGSRAERHIRSFIQVAEKAATGWVIPGTAGGVVKVPVTFYPQGAANERWIRARLVTVEVPDWVQAERAAKKVVALGEGGGAPSDRWKLLTSLEG